LRNVHAKRSGGSIFLTAFFLTHRFVRKRNLLLFCLLSLLRHSRLSTQLPSTITLKIHGLPLSRFGTRLALPIPSREKRMLKISLIDDPAQRRLVLEGELLAPWAAELKAACEQARTDLRPRELVVDLKCLTAISREGEELLFELMREGVKFRSRGVFTKQVLKQLARRVNGSTNGNTRR
jgi:hypothetical protein